MVAKETNALPRKALCIVTLEKQRKKNKGRYVFFLERGRAWEFWYFFPKKELGTPLHFNTKPPDLPPLGD